MSKFGFLKRIGLLGTLAFIMSGCVFDKEDNVPVAIYGPPEMFEDEPVYDGEAEHEGAENEDAEETPDSPTPVETAGADVPLDEDDPFAPGEREESDFPTGDFEARENMMPCIYGPPEMLTERGKADAE